LDQLEKIISFFAELCNLPTCSAIPGLAMGFLSGGLIGLFCRDVADSYRLNVRQIKSFLTKYRAL
jgi:hypothetical protein